MRRRAADGGKRPERGIWGVNRSFPGSCAHKKSRQESSRFRLSAAGGVKPPKGTQRRRQNAECRMQNAESRAKPPEATLRDQEHTKVPLKAESLYPTLAGRLNATAAFQAP